jgi:uncharacterized protein (TIGR03435 family)
MANSIAYRMNFSRKLLLAVAGSVVAVGPVLTGLVDARSQDAVRPRFEVATVKRDTSRRPNRFKMFPEVTVESATLKDLIKFAYGVEDFRLAGGPGWIDADRYEIQAKVEGNPGTFDLALQRQRLQTLLEDRFKLALHRERKELPIYELTVAKGGLRLQPLKEGDCIKRDPTKVLAPLAPGQKPSDFCGYGGFGRGSYENTTATMKNVAAALSTLVGRMVVDKTGITNTFHVRLTFAPDESTVPIPGTVGADDSGRPLPSDIGPNIFTAVQEQLGLKLESAKGPVDVLVIDRAERPTEN